jgi:predicted ABC-type ATPase
VKDILVLGGPNGAGKTTASQQLVPQRLGIAEFVNADEIARGLSPYNPDGVAIAAGRLMIERLRSLACGDQSFAFETTCAGRSHFRFLEHCKREGWRINLLYLWLPSPEVALERVAERVRQGGHSVPADVVVRRYWTGLANMRSLYLPLADVAAIYGNSDEARIFIAEKPEGSTLTVFDGRRWALIEGAVSDD